MHKPIIPAIYNGKKTKIPTGIAIRLPIVIFLKKIISIKDHTVKKKKNKQD